MSDYYKIIEANNTVTLELKVGDYVKKGWIPVGNIREEVHDKYNWDVTEKYKESPVVFSCRDEFVLKFHESKVDN